MKTNVLNLKTFFIFLFTLSLSTSWAQTPEWQEQLSRLDKEADQLYENKSWRKLVANQERYRKIIMDQQDSVRM